MIWTLRFAVHGQVSVFSCTHELMLTESLYHSCSLDAGTKCTRTYLRKHIWHTEYYCVQSVVVCRVLLCALSRCLRRSMASKHCCCKFIAKQTWLTFLRSLASSEGLAARAAAVGGPASRPFLASLAFALLCLGDSGTSRGTDPCSTKQVLGLCYTVNDMRVCVVNGTLCPMHCLKDPF